MAILTTATYPLFIGVLVAGIAFLAYSVTKDFMLRMQSTQPVAEPSFDEMSPQEQENLEAQDRAEKVRSGVMSEKARKSSVRDMMDTHFGDQRAGFGSAPGFRHRQTHWRDAERPARRSKGHRRRHDHRHG